MQDSIGKVYGQLTLIRDLGVIKERRWWLCQCTCGTVKRIMQQSLRSGATVSCGCYARQQRLKAITTHGLTHTPEYWVFWHMKQRCQNPKDVEYHNYGGRGITVCQGWSTIEGFYADMGNRPSDKHSLERKNNDGGYWCGHCSECLTNRWPANCKWATVKQQNNNRRGNRRITFQGRTLTLTEWATEYHLNPHTLSERVAARWPIELALTFPVKGNGWEARCILGRTNKKRG